MRTRRKYMKLLRQHLCNGIPNIHTIFENSGQAFFPPCYLLLSPTTKTITRKKLEITWHCLCKFIPNMYAKNVKFRTYILFLLYEVPRVKQSIENATKGKRRKTHLSKFLQCYCNYCPNKHAKQGKYRINFFPLI